MFIFLGKELHGGTKAKLITLNYQSKQDSAILSWKLTRDMNVISVTSFQDIWAVFALNPKTNPVFNKLNNVVKTY